MNLVLKARDLLWAISPALVHELDAVVTRANTVWRVNHHPETGAHTSLTFTGTTQATVGSAGAATALPATPTGYYVMTIAGTEVVIPYYDKT